MKTIRARFFLYFLAGSACLASTWNTVHSGGALARDPKTDAPINLKVIFSKEAEAYARSIIFHPDGKSVAVAADSGAIGIWDAVTGKEKLKFQAGGKVGAMAWDPKGGRLVAALYFEKKIKCWELETGKEIFSVDTNATIPSIACHPDGKEFAVAGYGSIIEFRAPQNGAVVRTIRPGGTRITDIAIAPDGKTLASASIDKLARISDLISGEVLFTLKGHKGSVEAVCFSKSGKLLASASTDKTVKIWDAKSGEVIRTIPLARRADKVAFSPDGKWLAIASGVGGSESFLSLHDAATGREVAIGENMRNPTRGLGFNREGTLIAGAAGSTVRVWEITEQKAPAEKGVPDPKQK